MIVDPKIGGTGGVKPDPRGHPGSQNRHVCQISPIFPVFLDFRPQNAFSAVFSCFQLLKLVPWTRIYSPPQVLAGDSLLVPTIIKVMSVRMSHFVRDLRAGGAGLQPTLLHRIVAKGFGTCHGLFFFWPPAAPGAVLAVCNFKNEF